MIQYVFAFFAGGIITLAVTAFELAGMPILSGIAALFPVTTWVSYLVVGHISGATAVSRHAQFVMFGTLVAWMPYMFIIYYGAPRVGVVKAIGLGILVFLLIAFFFVLAYNRFLTS